MEMVQRICSFLCLSVSSTLWLPNWLLAGRKVRKSSGCQVRQLHLNGCTLGPAGAVIAIVSDGTVELRRHRVLIGVVPAEPVVVGRPQADCAGIRWVCKCRLYRVLSSQHMLPFTCAGIPHVRTQQVSWNIPMGTVSIAGMPSIHATRAYATTQHATCHATRTSRTVRASSVQTALAAWGAWHLAHNYSSRRTLRTVTVTFAEHRVDSPYESVTLSVTFVTPRL
jgi:hypothetical protein